MSHTYTEDTLVQQTTAEYRMNFQVNSRDSILISAVNGFEIDILFPESLKQLPAIHGGFDRGKMIN